MNEFKRDGDKTYWDLFAERTSKEVILQQDRGWTAAAGLNPAKLVRRYPGRTKITHFKPTVVNNEPGKKAILGQDPVNWIAVLAACREVGGIEWITFEQEFYPDGTSPMACTELSRKGLKKIWEPDHFISPPFSIIVARTLDIRGGGGGCLVEATFALSLCRSETHVERRHL
jgi:sugar phosphate isomerase/epimerase